MAAAKVSSTLTVLREIRDELRTNNARLATVESNVDDLRRYVPEVEMRLATAIGDLAGLLRGELVTELRDLRERVARLERKAG